MCGDVMEGEVNCDGWCYAYPSYLAIFFVRDLTPTTRDPDHVPTTLRSGGMIV